MKNFEMVYLGHNVWEIQDKFKERVAGPIEYTEARKMLKKLENELIDIEKGAQTDV
jgi:hypothetical protein